MDLWKRLLNFFRGTTIDQKKTHSQNNQVSDFQKDSDFIQGRFNEDVIGRSVDEDGDGVQYYLVKEPKKIPQYQKIKISDDQRCYVCGKRDLLPLKGRDGRYYCQLHIIPENRTISPNSPQSKAISAPAFDTTCKNPRCKRGIYHEEIIQCGPCGNFFCRHCWEGHRWSHGKSPAVGIGYTSDGKYYGYDGTERFQK